MRLSLPASLRSTRFTSPLTIAGVATVAMLSLAACSSDSPAISSATTDAATDTTCVDTIMSPCQGMGRGGDGDGDHGGRGGFDPAAMQTAVNSFTECLRGEGLDVDDVDMSTLGGGGDGDRDQDGPPSSDGIMPDGSMPMGGGDDGPGRDGGPGGDMVSHIASDLGLDMTDATVSAAVDTCAASLSSAFPPPPGGDGNTSTTAAG